MTSSDADPHIFEAFLTPDDAMIALSPPLPWVSEGGMGFVVGLGRETLQLEAVSSGFTPQAISVGLRDGSRATLVGAAEWQGPGLMTFRPDADHSPLLDDLRGIIRKAQHIAICQTQDVEASDRFTGFGDVSLLPEALPELNMDELDLRTRFLGRDFDLPLLITGMTGGIDEGAMINRRLARAAARYNIPMGVGSQRIALEHPQHAAIFAVKDEVPGVFLIGNLGAAQLLNSDAPELCRRAVGMIGADALAIHLNVLQELVQVEGDRKFKGFFKIIGTVVKALKVPVIVKEVGAGIGPEAALRLRELGVAAIDVGGRGGTSWSHIEGLRSADSSTRELGLSFRDWGIPTAYALHGIKKVLPTMELVATGGIRDGLTVAKAVALGARMCGVGLPLMRAAVANDEAVQRVIETLARGLRIAMLASGAQDLGALPQRVVRGLPGQAAFRRADSSGSEPWY